MMPLKRVAICSGDPAGVGVELCLRLATWQTSFADMVFIILADESLLKQRAFELGQSINTLSVDITCLNNEDKLRHLHTQAKAQQACLVYPISLNSPVQAGELNVNNVPYVLKILQSAHQLCVNQHTDAILTLPIHKGIINTYLKQEKSLIAPTDNQIDETDFFHGHTEFFQHMNDCEEVVMMLACESLVVALATTHIPLAQVPTSLHAVTLSKKLKIVHQHYLEHTGNTPKIAVLGLNPHAGDGGHIGTEETEIIQPVVRQLRTEGLDLSDVISADTAFIPANLRHYDCFFGMYHDQVLPIIKHVGFHRTTNITLGLPYVRISVDHGTALDIVGTSEVNDGSLHYSLTYLKELLSRV